MDNNNSIAGSSFDLSVFNVPDQIIEHLKKIMENDFFVAVVTESYLRLGVQVAMELGTAIMSDKKIGLLIKRDTKVPEKMTLLADAVEYFENEKDMATNGSVLLARLEAIA